MRVKGKRSNCHLSELDERPPQCPLRVMNEAERGLKQTPATQPSALMAVIGYTLAATGIVLYTQLDRIVNLRMGENVLCVAVISSMAATFGGFVIAIVCSAIWARRGPTRQLLKVAVLIGIGSFVLCLVVGVNVHGPSAMLMFLVPLSVVNVLSLLARIIHEKWSGV